MSVEQQQEATSLYQSATRLMSLGMDGSPLYCETYSHLSGEVYRLANELYEHDAPNLTVEADAFRCLSLLMGFGSTFCDRGDKQLRIQHTLDHCWELLDRLPPSSLKACLLFRCYEETYDETLLNEARAISADEEYSLFLPNIRN